MGKHYHTNEFIQIKYIAQQIGYKHNLADTVLKKIIRKPNKPYNTETKQKKHSVFT